MPDYFLWIETTFMTINCTGRGVIAALAPFLMLLYGSSSLAQSKSGAAGTDNKLDSPYAALRFGIVASPILGADAGLDVTFPRLSLGKSWSTRLDLDLEARLVSRSFGSRRDGEAYTMLCQVYTPGGVNVGRYFVGAGAGVVFGPHSGLAAKLFAGINISKVVSLELEERFPGDATTRTVVMIRFSAL